MFSFHSTKHLSNSLSDQKTINDIFKKYIKGTTSSIEVDEVRIKLASGLTIAGKWWGNKNVKPFLCVHGWQDNAGTFDRLIPLLPCQFSYLAIDFPGHGRSSWIPNGVPYSFDLFIYVLFDLIKTLGYSKIGIIGHSMGSIVAFTFSSLFPELVEFLVSTDAFKIYRRTISERIDEMRFNIRNFEMADKRNRKQLVPTAFTIPNMITKLSEGSMGNVTLESSAYILRRNVIEASNQNGKFQFSRDGRLRIMTLIPHPEALVLYMAKNIKFPFLFLMTAEDVNLFMKFDYFDRFVDILETKECVKIIKIDSKSHYFHLNEPEKICKVINNFLIQNSKLSHL